MNINKIIVFSYYHPWIAGGAHRPHQILIQDLLKGREVVFICTSKCELENAKIFSKTKLYKKFALFYFNSLNGNLEPVTTFAKTIAKHMPTLEDILNKWEATYARSHQPLECLVPFLKLIQHNNVPFIYDQMDYWAGFAVQPWGSNKTENEFIYYADAITTISKFLVNKFAYTGKIHLIPNAINPAFLNSLQIKRQSKINQKKNKKSEIIYAGAMWPDWFDWNLVFYIIENRPNYNFTFIGPWKTMDEDDGRPVYRYIDRLTSYKNVKLIGEVPHKKLVNYLSKSDIGLIPFIVNDVTVGCSPLKVFEYLGASMKVVSTALPEIADYPCVYVCDDYKEFLDNLDNVATNKLDTKTELIIKDFCQNNTWVTQVNNIDKLVQSIINKKTKIQ